MKKYITSSADETRKVGMMIAEGLASGGCVLLDGDLGAGKTVVASGIIKALTGENYAATSPTFNIVNEYQGKTKVNHFDFYRIESPDELDNIGIFEYLYSDAVNIIEWPARAPCVLGDDLEICKVTIKKLSDVKREIIVD